MNRITTAADRMRETGALEEDRAEPCIRTDHAFSALSAPADIVAALRALRDEVRDGR